MSFALGACKRWFSQRAFSGKAKTKQLNNNMATVENKKKRRAVAAAGSALLLLGAAAHVGCLSGLLPGADGYHGAGSDVGGGRRALRVRHPNRVAENDGEGRGLSKFVDPRSTSARVAAAVVHEPSPRRDINIYVVGVDASNPGNSIFQTDALSRYGSGRFDFRVHDDIPCDGEGFALPDPSEGSPCVAATRVPKNHGCPADVVRGAFPTCKLMVTNDERCQSERFGRYDAREYFSSTKSATPGYLPLGMRFDTWRAFGELQSSPGYVALPSSRRKYAFNAIFSQSTNTDRKALANVIESELPKHEGSMAAYVNMAKKWHKPTDRNFYKEQTHQGTYVEVLSDSAFTLSPAGNNPECFRLFEAAEASSILVFLRSELFDGLKGGEPHPCGDALVHWREAPAVVLDKWEDLFPTLGALLARPDELDAMQSRFAEWYDGYMRRVVREFEDFMLTPPAPPAAAVAEA